MFVTFFFFFKQNMNNFFGFASFYSFTNMVQFFNNDFSSLHLFQWHSTFHKSFYQLHLAFDFMEYFITKKS